MTPETGTSCATSAERSGDSAALLAAAVAEFLGNQTPDSSFVCEPQASGVYITSLKETHAW